MRHKRLSIISKVTWLVGCRPGTKTPQDQTAGALVLITLTNNFPKSFDFRQYVHGFPNRISETCMPVFTCQIVCRAG